MRKFLLVIPGSALSLTLIAEPARASDQVTISGGDWVAAGVERGKPLVADFYGSSSGAPKCKVRINGPTRRVLTGLRMKGLNLRIQTRGLRPGVYSIRVKCPGNKAITMPRAAVVKKGTTGQGTCSVADYGFTAWPASLNPDRTYVTIGMILRNDNEYVPSAEGDLIINFLDASGRIVETQLLGMSPIQPGRSRPSGSTFALDGVSVAAVEVITTCHEIVTSLESQEILDLPARGYVDDGRVTVEGEVTNTQSKVWSSASVIRFVTRDVNGNISGGDVLTLETPLPPGATIRWDSSFAKGGQVDASSVEATISPVED